MCSGRHKVDDSLCDTVSNPHGFLQQHANTCAVVGFDIYFGAHSITILTTDLTLHGFDNFVMINIIINIIGFTLRDDSLSPITYQLLRFDIIVFYLECY